MIIKFSDFTHTMKTKFGWGLLTVAVVTLFACSSSNQVSKTQNSNSSQWYKQAENFMAGPNAYTAMATSLSSDSTIALYKADQTALANLRSGMQKQLEQLRRKLVNQKMAYAGKPEFILLIRGAVPDKMNKADRTKSLVFSKDGIYQAYVEFSYLKSDLSNDLLNALSSNMHYSTAVKNASAFKNWESPQPPPDTPDEVKSVK